ncbi:MAG: hypothetical protein RIR00_209 [Pseudomonadota bacterium]|jgi:twitching motility protein PilI
MAKKISLRQFQEHLSTRLNSVARGEGASSMLGVAAGDRQWLLDLSDSGEIVQLPPLVHVPLTRPTFAGIANIRGNLYSVTDFSVFCGGEATPLNAYARLLLIGTKYGSNAALLVTRMLGLKNPNDFTPEADSETAPTWGRQTLRDKEGRRWHKLAIRELLADNDFMNIGT